MQGLLRVQRNQQQWSETFDVHWQAVDTEDYVNRLLNATICLAAHSLLLALQCGTIGDIAFSFYKNIGHITRWIRFITTARSNPQCILSIQLSAPLMAANGNRVHASSPLQSLRADDGARWCSSSPILSIFSMSPEWTRAGLLLPAAFLSAA